MKVETDHELNLLMEAGIVGDSRSRQATSACGHPPIGVAEEKERMIIRRDSVPGETLGFQPASDVNHDGSTLCWGTITKGARGCPIEGGSRYRLRHPLGQGGTSLTYLAFDTILERHVALKHFLEPQTVSCSWFLHEARALARIDHTHICTIYDVGLVGGIPFLAMQYIEGATLCQHAGDLSLQETLTVFHQIALGLEAAHRAGVIHRDIKPGNIMVRRGSEGSPEAVLIDFGLARFDGPADLEAEGTLSGTPAFMSPEQARGEQADLDHRTDLFSLGATLYYALLGSRPFPGTDLVSLIHQILEKEPVLPSSLPESVRDILSHCLEKEPSNRYPSAQHLADDLSRCLRGRPTTTATQSLEKYNDPTLQRKMMG